jgi:hypothetical protein
MLSIYLNMKTDFDHVISTTESRIKNAEIKFKAV